jgi:UDP-glucose 4-epimerase
MWRPGKAGQADEGDRQGAALGGERSMNGTRGRDSDSWAKNGRASFGRLASSATPDPSRNGRSRRFRRSRRFLITGGAGFIGSHLAEALVARGDTVVALDNLSTGRLENIAHLLGDGVELIKGSVSDAALVDECAAEADFCFHLASAVGVEMIVEDPLETLMRNVRGSNVVMHAAACHGLPVLFASTSEVYGKRDGLSLSEHGDLVLGSPSKGRWTYAIAKSFGEALVHGYHRQRGVDATVVRLFNTVGPRQTGAYGMVLPRFVQQALAGEDLTVFGTGKQTRCFTHVLDAVEALVLLSDHNGAFGNAYNVGSSTPVSILQLAGQVIERTGSGSRVLLVPYEDAYGDGFEELGIRRPDTSALRALTGWRPRRTLDVAIDDVIAYERDGEFAMPLLTDAP